MSPAVTAPPAPVTAVRSVLDIPRLCTCDWRHPDYSRPPHRRVWTLRKTAINPGCRIHGTRDGDAS